MTSFSMYDATVPVLDRLLGNLTHILKTGEDNAKSRDIDSQVFINARLAPDMHPLLGQVQIVTSLAKNCPHRIAGTPPPIFEENETSFADLYTTINKARTEINKFQLDQLNGHEARQFSVKLGPRNMDFTGLSYLNGFTLPNIYFHNTTAYNILRQNGVPLGKMDFFGGIL